MNLVRVVEGPMAVVRLEPGLRAFLKVLKVIFSFKRQAFTSKTDMGVFYWYCKIYINEVKIWCQLPFKETCVVL